MNESLLWFGVIIFAIRYAGSLHCFQCTNIMEDEDCTTVNQCLSNQNCYSQRSGSANNTLFTLGCIESQHCPDHHQFTIVGRAAKNPCMECCMRDGCNKELCEVKHTAAPVNPSGICADDVHTNCSQLSALIDICSDIRHARTVCRHYCGLCALVDGGWSDWTSWSTCSRTCGLGTHTRQKSCSNPAPQHGGDNCVGNSTNEHSCFLRACPVHGEWSGWAPWESCSASCGDGLNKRHRTCTNPAPSLYGHYCIGDPVEYNICHGHMCGNLTTTANSSHTVEQCHDILSDCDLANRTSGVCLSQQSARKICPEYCGLCAIVDGKWASWGTWGTCSTTCGNGSWTRTRTCSDPAPVKGGSFCVGNSKDTGVCNLRECPVHGGWSSWAHWTTCSSSCGQGITHRTRSCTNPRPSLQGNFCFGDSTEYGLCLISPCPVNGQWTAWSLWSGCSVFCGSGHITRQRYCTNPSPAHGGHSCTGSGTATTTCRGTSCPVNGGWTSWGSWSSCESVCGAGLTKRRRSCTNPRPSSSGTACLGDYTITKICYGDHDEGHVQLLGGGQYYGTVQICHNARFGTVCDDSWDNNDARVVCRMLGYYSGGAAVGNSFYGTGHGNITLDDVDCSGVESSLLQCTHRPIGTHNCGHSEDAGVNCTV